MELCFSIGLTVLKKDFRRKRRREGKLDYRWVGPYEIVKSLRRGLFTLKDSSGKVTINYNNSYTAVISIIMHVQVIKRVNGYHLKKYLTPNNSDESSIHDEDSIYNLRCKTLIPQPYLW